MSWVDVYGFDAVPRGLALTLGEQGVLWADDGAERMAVIVQERALRFFRNGIRARCDGLLRRYLRDLVLIRAGDFVINFGANIGELAVGLERLGAHVLAIEPDPHVLPALRANAEGRRIDIAPVAAWHSRCDLSMSIETQNADTSAFGNGPLRKLIPARRIDALARGRRIRLIVGDAEGAEPEVLAGATDVLRLTDYVSVSGSDERCGERTVDACDAILRDAGFEIIYREDAKFCILIGKAKSV